jgi:protein-disulfide isomerase
MSAVAGAIFWIAIAQALVFLASRELRPGGRLFGMVADRTPVSRDWQALIAGARAVRGSVKAPVTILEVVDYQCAPCAHAERRVRTIAEEYPTKVRVVLRHASSDVASLSNGAVIAAECARTQGKFAALHELLLERQAEFGFTPWTDLARAAGVEDIERFESCQSSGDMDSISVRDMAATRAAGVKSTPAVFIDGRNVETFTLGEMRALTRLAIRRVSRQ